MEVSKKRCRYFSRLICSCEHYCQLAQLLEHTGSKNSKARWGIEHKHNQLTQQGQQLSVGLPSPTEKSIPYKHWVYCGLMTLLFSLSCHSWQRYLLWLRHRKMDLLYKKVFYANQKFSRWQPATLFCKGHNNPINTPFVD